MIKPRLDWRTLILSSRLALIAIAPCCQACASMCRLRSISSAARAKSMQSGCQTQLSFKKTQLSTKQRSCPESMMMYPIKWARTQMIMSQKRSFIRSPPNKTRAGKTWPQKELRGDIIPDTAKRVKVSQLISSVPLHIRCARLCNFFSFPFKVWA